MKINDIVIDAINDIVYMKVSFNTDEGSTMLVNPTRGDEYLMTKFGKLQEAAVFACAEISAVSETVRPAEECEAVLWAIAPVERLARMLQLLEPSTKAGARMVQRAAAWLDGGSLDCLLEPMEIAA